MSKPKRDERQMPRPDPDKKDAPKPISLSYRRPKSLSSHPTVSGTGRTKLEEWVRAKVERGQATDILGLVREFETALEDIARGKRKGMERSYAGERLRDIRASLDASFNRER